MTIELHRKINQRAIDKYFESMQIANWELNIKGVSSEQYDKTMKEVKHYHMSADHLLTMIQAEMKNVDAGEHFQLF